MPRHTRSYLRSGAVERVFGRVLAYLVWIGLIREGRQYLVCARGNSNWVRNARIASEVALARAMRRRRYAVRELPPGMRSPILKAYLDRFAGEVQRFFPVPKGSPVEAFSELAPRYPVFELQPLDETALR
jgi:hypothetical protein